MKPISREIQDAKPPRFRSCLNKYPESHNPTAKGTPQKQPESTKGSARKSRIIKKVIIYKRPKRRHADCCHESRCHTNESRHHSVESRNPAIDRPQSARLRYNSEEKQPKPPLRPRRDQLDTMESDRLDETLQ